MKAKNKSKKKKIAVVTSLLALVAMLAGTFAWTSYTEWVKNHMQSRGYEEGRVTIIEEFDGDKKPIDENPVIKKDVKVVNTSSADAFVRVSFEEMLQKLTAGAKTQAYGNVDAASFPVIFNASEYKDTYTDKTEFLKVLHEDGTPALPEERAEGLTLYVSSDEKNAVLLNKVSMSDTDWPKDFNLEQKDSVVPLFSGSWKGGDAVVAQKVTGAVTKQTDGSWVVYTNKYKDTEADKNIGYWGYGQGLGKLMEHNWAGFNQNLSTEAGDTRPGDADLAKSAIADSGITFTMGEITTTKPTVAAGADKDWYYNSADGYFYYTKALKAGTTTDSSVIKEINFDLTTDDSFKVASYNLHVGLEAIPAAQSAIVAESKFGELTTPTVEGSKSWERNGSGWGLTDTELVDYYNSIATIVE